MKKEKLKSIHNRKFQKDYDLSKISDRKNYIGAINRRIKETAKTFGIDSLLYKQTITEIQQILFRNSNIFKTNKEDILYLSKGKEFIEDNQIFNVLEKKEYINKDTLKEFLDKTLVKMKERGEIDSDVKMNTQLQGPPTADGKYPTIRNSVIQYAEEAAELSADIRDDFGFLYGNEDDEEILDAINTLRITGRRKTIDEMRKISKAINKAIAIENEDPYRDF